VGLDPREQAVQRGVQVGTGQHPGVGIEAEEAAVPVAGLDQPVGVEQHPLAGGHPVRGLLRSAAQPQGQGGLAGVDRLHGPVRADQQRRVVAAVGVGHRPVRVELGQDRGDEVLVAHHSGDDLVQLRGDTVELGRDHRRLAEAAQHGRRQVDRLDALAAYVSHDHAHAVRRGDHLVEVATDQRVGGRGLVAGSEAQPAGVAWQRAEQCPLGGLRDQRHPPQRALTTGSDHGTDDGQRADDDQEGHPDQPVDLGHLAPEGAGPAGHDREHGDQHGRPDAGQRGGHQGSDREGTDQHGTAVEGEVEQHHRQEDGESQDEPLQLRRPVGSPAHRTSPSAACLAPWCGPGSVLASDPDHAAAASDQRRVSSRRRSSS
jgi:hypothetical protein